MPYQEVDRWKFSKVSMAVLRCYLAVIYLWAMVTAAALIPVPHEKKSKWLFWVTSEQYSVTYTSLLPFDYSIQGHILLVAIQLLYRLFYCCRCNFIESIDPQENINYENKTPFDRRLLWHFGPYLVIFIINWLSSIFFIYLTVLWLYHHQVTRKETLFLCELALVIIFKLIVLINAIIRIIRGMIILNIFGAEPDDYLRNDNNFGEHLKLFFQL